MESFKSILTLKPYFYILTLITFMAGILIDSSGVSYLKLNLIIK